MPRRNYDQPDRYTTVNYDYTKISGTPPPADSSAEEVTYIRRGHYAGETTPNFMARKMRGELIPPRAYARFDAEERRPNGVYGGTFKNTAPSPDRIYTYRSTPTRACAGNSLTKDQASSYVNELCGHGNVNTTALLQAALAQIKPELDTLTTLAEAHKTVNLILGVRRNFLRLVKMSLKGGYASVKAAADSWLEFRYGWRQLGFDIENVTKYVEKPYRDTILEGRSGTSVVKDDVFTNPYGGGYYCVYDVVTRVNRDLSVRASAVARFSNRNTNLSFQPVSTAWELLPYSFVADWFVSVGESLAAWEVLSTSVEAYCSLSFKYKETSELSLENIRLGDGEYAESGYASGGSSAYCEYIIRTPCGAPNLTPQFRTKLTSARIIDAAALLIGTKAAAARIRR